jgi:phage terminase small subunit
MKQGVVHQRRTRFVKEFLKDHNAKQAAIRTGYSERSATVTASRLLANANVAKQIAEAEEKLNAKYDLTAERIRQEIARLCYYDPGAYFNEDGTAKPIGQIDEDSRRAIAGFENAELFEGNGEKRNLAGYVKKFKLADKNRALETAARCLKMLTDRVEVTDSDQILKRLAQGRERARGSSQ